MWFAFTLALTLESLQPTGILPFALAAEGAIVVPVKVQGQGPFRFLLDTGASQSVITDRLAARLGLEPASQTVLLTASGGRTARSVTAVPAMEVGPLHAVNVMATILPSDQLGLSRPIDGILGQNVLAAAVYTIDYRRKVIEWHSGTREVAGTRLAVEVRQGRLLVVVPSRSIKGRPLRFVPDSGSDGLVLFARDGRELPPMTPLAMSLLRTVSGQQLVRRVRLDGFAAGDLRLDGLSAVLVPRSDTDFLDGDGLLPLHIFSAVTLNARGGYLVVQR